MLATVGPPSDVVPTTRVFAIAGIASESDARALSINNFAFISLDHLDEASRDSFKLFRKNEDQESVRAIPGRFQTVAGPHAEQRPICV